MPVKRYLGIDFMDNQAEAHIYKGLQDKAVDPLLARCYLIAAGKNGSHAMRNGYSAAHPGGTPGSGSPKIGSLAHGGSGVAFTP